MSAKNPAAAQALRRYLQQRLELGERVAMRVTGTAATPDVVAPAPTAAPPSARPRAAAAPAPPGESLAQVAAEVRACTRCRLHQTRTQAVPGVGPDNAAVLFIGEGPGADEDAQGEPFVGRAGQLLTKIIESVQLRRPEVFITNVVKCRPPNNRDPEPDEIAACLPFLERQVQLLSPSVICTLGRHAASTLLGKQEAMGRLRTGTHTYGTIPLFPTYHPAALLRNPQWKRPVWEDIQKVRRAYDAAREST